MRKVVTVEEHEKELFEKAVEMSEKYEEPDKESYYEPQRIFGSSPYTGEDGVYGLPLEWGKPEIWFVEPEEGEPFLILWDGVELRLYSIGGELRGQSSPPRLGGELGIVFL